MNLDELRSVQSKERQKDSLQNLRPSFYQEVGEYIADLEDERDRVAERADDPFSSPEVGRLTDEIETAKDVVEAIYERRMGKLVKQASLAAAGMPADDEGLTAEEADLFDDLVDRIGSNKSRVLDVLEGIESAADDTRSAADDGPSAPADPAGPESSPDDPTAGRPSADDAPPAPPEEPPAAADPAADGRSQPDASSEISPADVMGGDGPSPSVDGADVDDADGAPATDPSDADPERSSEPDADGAASGAETGPVSGSDGRGDSSVSDGDTEQVDEDIDRTTVRITSDIGAILGVDDREYTLTADDVVTLPEQNAAPLVEREAAERLE